MKKIALLSIFGLVVAIAALATVIVNTGPTSLVPDPILVKASSNPVGLFELALSQDAGETLSSISVVVNNTASSTATTTDLASISVYKDNGDGNFDPTTDLLAGTQTVVNIGSATTVATTSNNSISGGKFFISLSTAVSWSDTVPADSVTVTLPADGIVTSANSPTITAVTTNTITADTTAPSLTSVVAKNTGGTAAKEAGDSVELTFSESTNKPVIDTANVNTVFVLSNGHSFLDGQGNLGGAAWNITGTVLTITLSATGTATTTLPSVEVGDTLTIAGSVIKDLAGNLASGTKTITGSFSSGGEDEEGQLGTHCSNNLINGRLYKIGVNSTVYLAAACRLKPFRGAAVFHARGQKFQNIIILNSLEGLSVSQRPVLPSEGTLVQGSGQTVWFVGPGETRRGFRTAAKFLALEFDFKQVKKISDQDLALLTEGAPIEESENHPSGSLLKCGNSATVFQIISGTRFPFSNANAFLNRGHAWESIANVDCGRFHYLHGAPIDN